MRRWRIGLLVFIGSAAAALAQTAFDAARILSANAASTRLMSKKRAVGDMKIWRVGDAASPFYGLTLVVIRLGRGAVDVQLDTGAKMLSDDAFNTAPDRPLVVVSGGLWTEHAGGWTARTPSGLVIRNSTREHVEEAGWKAGGVFLRCGDELMILTSSEFLVQSRAASINGRWTTPCDVRHEDSVFGLQTKLLLVNRSRVPVNLDRDPPANRVAIGLDRNNVVVAGAFTANNSALSTRDFAAVLAAEARRELPDFQALDLDGACGAQIYIPGNKPSKFGCSGETFSMNRFIIKGR